MGDLRCDCQLFKFTYLMDITTSLVSTKFHDFKIQRKPDNRELASPCQLICKIIHVSRERLVPYYRVFSVVPPASPYIIIPPGGIIIDLSCDCQLFKFNY